MGRLGLAVSRSLRKPGTKRCPDKIVGGRS